MSKENVELVRRSLDSVNRGDIDGALELAADDLEMDWSNSIGPAKGVYRGAQLWPIHDGKAQTFKLYQSKAEALEAAGLRE